MDAAALLIVATNATGDPAIGHTFAVYVGNFNRQGISVQVINDCARRYFVQILKFQMLITGHRAIGLIRLHVTALGFVDDEGRG